MITLKADNRDLLTGAKYSFLNTNYLSGVSSVVVTNSVGFDANDYILLGGFGQESSEIVQIQSINTSTHTLTLVAATKFSHSESTKVAILPYNQVRFYHTTTATFSATSPVTGYTDIQADSFYTQADDSVNSTGYGWFVFYNSTTTNASANSNAIPYAGFALNSAQRILDSFYSHLNNKERQLVSDDDAFYWLNEAYAIARNELNLVTNNYTAETYYDISAVSGTSEYAVPTNFSNALSVYNSTSNLELETIKLSEIDDWNSVSANRTKYYIRGGYIGFSPAITSSITFRLRYNTKAAELTSYYDTIDLPDNNHYCVIDYMLYRAAPKLGRVDGAEYKRSFGEKIATMKLVSSKQDGGKDSWDILDEVNV